MAYSVKILVFLLVLANLLFYAFSQGVFGHADNPDAARVQQQINPEGLRIVARDEAPAAPVPETPPPAPAVPAPEAAPLCLAWSGLSAVEAERLAALFGERFAAYAVAYPANEAGGTDGKSWWVYMPPLADRAAAERKTAELRALGVRDYFILPDGLNRFAISLGIFSSEKAAREYLGELQGKGVRSARVGPRPDKAGRVTLELRGAQAGRDALLEATSRLLPRKSAQDCP
jgi:hypothetical protein